MKYPDLYEPIAEGDKECEIWPQAVNYSDDTRIMGSGRKTVDGVRIIATRYVWQLYCGSVPEGLMVLHKCNDSRCVKISHLFLGTHSSTKRTHCPKGHELSGDNLDPGEMRLTGKRRCRTCRQARGQSQSRRAYMKKYQVMYRAKKREEKANANL